MTDLTLKMTCQNLQKRDSNKSHNECTYFDLLGYDSHNTFAAIHYEAKARDEITIQLMSNNQTFILAS